MYWLHSIDNSISDALDLLGIKPLPEKLILFYHQLDKIRYKIKWNSDLKLLSAISD